jgi:hypothetical protein
VLKEVVEAALERARVKGLNGMLDTDSRVGVGLVYGIVGVEMIDPGLTGVLDMFGKRY